MSAMQSSRTSRKPTSRQKEAIPAALALKVRSLLTSGDTAAIDLGVTLLESLEAPKRAWDKVFSDQTLRKIVNSWDAEIWRRIASSVSQRPPIIRRLARVCKSLFPKLSGQKQKRFLESFSEQVGPEVCLFAQCFSAFTGPDTHFGVGYLELNRLKALPDASAAIVAKAQCGLSLENISTLTETAARSLCEHEGHLGLNGLLALPDAVAEGLSGHRGWLSLRSVKSLSEKAARSFLRTRGMLALENVALDDRQAELLSDCKCRVLWFEPYMLENLDRSQERLQQRLAFVHRDGFDGKKRSFDTSVSLSHYHRVGYQSPSLSVEEARALLTCPGFIGVDVWQLTDAVAKVLSAHAGGLGIECPCLSDTAAARLARTTGPLVTSLHGGRRSSSKVLSPSAARMLARHHDYVALGRERDLLRPMK
jgi:hypothetical protein